MTAPSEAVNEHTGLVGHGAGQRALFERAGRICALGAEMRGQSSGYDGPRNNAKLAKTFG